jgi:DNA-binding XRE family transcriptional regulator
MTTLRQIRQERGLTLVMVAELIGTKPRTLSSWEKLQTIPNLLDAVLLARCYEVSLDDIVLAFGL